jgi:hypothetical protein
MWMNKLITATIAAAVLMVALSPVVVNQVLAFPGEQGKGHETTVTQTCENPGGQVKSGDCPGQSEGATPIEEDTTTTTTAGKSSHVKNTQTDTE